METFFCYNVIIKHNKNVNAMILGMVMTIDGIDSSCKIE